MDDTRKELSKIAGVGEQTISRVKVIEAKAEEAVKEKLLSGEISINQARTMPKNIKNGNSKMVFCHCSVLSKMANF